ncbi:MAG: hypothetical protein AAB405_02545 [Patescibacteria group bacterium]
MKKRVLEKSKKEKIELTRTERHFGVLLESMDSKIDLVVEGQDLLNQKADRHYQEFQDFRKEVDFKFGVVFDELHLIRNDLKEKVGRDEFLILEKRVMALEKSKK